MGIVINLDVMMARGEKKGLKELSAEVDITTWQICPS